MKRKLPSHPQHPLYVPGLVQPSALTEVPYAVITGAPQNTPVVLPCDHVVEDQVIIPGPPGPAGLRGTMGPPGFDGEPGEDAPPIPGPAGAAGSAGAPGVAGAMGPPGVDGEPADDWPVLIPGPQGPQGIQGIPGVGGGGGTSVTYLIPQFDEGCVDDSLAFMGMGGVSGTGTINRLPKWGGGNLLVNSLISEANGWTITDSHIQPGGMISPNPADTFVFDADTLPNYGVHWFSDSRSGFTSMSLGGYGGISMFTNGVERLWIGAGTVIRAGLTIDAAANNTYDIGSGGNYFRNVFAATGFGFSGTNVLTQVAGNTRLNGPETELAYGGVLGWKMNSTGWLESFAIAGAGGLWAKDIVTIAADAASFANVQTNTGLSFDTQINCTYDVDVVITTTMVLATGVKFYFTGPPGMTGEIQYFGTMATLNTSFRTDYQAVLTVPATFYNTVAGTHQYLMRATIRIAGTSATVRVVGITGGATTTCVVKKGSSMRFRRV